MSAKLRERYAQGAAGVIEPGERVEWGLDGRPGTFGNYVLNSARIFPPTRQLILTDRNVYILELRKGKVGEVLFKRERAAASARYKYFPPMLIVDEQAVTPTLQSAGRCKGVTDALDGAGAASQTADSTA